MSNFIFSCCNLFIHFLNFSFSAINTSGRLVKIYIIFPHQNGTPETLEELCRTGLLLLLNLFLAPCLFVSKSSLFCQDENRHDNQSFVAARCINYWGRRLIKEEAGVGSKWWKGLSKSWLWQGLSDLDFSHGNPLKNSMYTPGLLIGMALFDEALIISRFSLAQHFASLRIGAYSDLSAVRRQVKHSSNSPRNDGESSVLPKHWVFLDSKYPFYLIPAR